MAALTADDITTARRVLSALDTANHDSSDTKSGDAQITRAIRRTLVALTDFNDAVEGADPA